MLAGAGGRTVPVRAREHDGGQQDTACVLASLDLGPQDAGELDVLGRVVGVDVVGLRQVGDRFHRSRLPGEDREHGLAGVLGYPAPADRQCFHDVQAAPVHGIAVKSTHDRRIRREVADHDRER